MSNYPKFAVVGHPNKGKSSIVSTLSQDATVTISSIPGTTTQQRGFPFKVDGKTLYTLYDTPGFQRARAILGWLKKEPTRADKRADRLKKFLYEHRDNPRFSDEIELLTPIINGAGIIYVVDGSKPYGAEYEAEMEILRYSGEPSMALINLIGEENYLEDWQKALHHYFKIVRVFNPMEASFSQIIELLEAMGELKYEWKPNIKSVIATLKDYQLQKISQTSSKVRDSIVASITHSEKEPIKSNIESQKRELEERYKKHILKLEDDCYHDIAKVWHHSKLEIEALDTISTDVELFSKESVEIFGLDKKELIKTATLAGALTGSGVDLMLGGHSLMLGTTIGALIGGGGAVVGVDRLQKIKMLGKSLFSQQKVVTVGPMRDPNFPFVLLRRVLYFAKEIANRPHANRAKISIDSERLFHNDWINESVKRELFALHKNFVNQKKLEASSQRYRELIEKILLEYIDH